jgi:hypothetical protein
LPLVGGGEHDWAFLLTRLGWLKFDHVIARDAWFLGVLAYILAIAGGVVFANRITADSSEAAQSEVTNWRPS